MKSGIAFRNAYCASPVCSASRAAFWTGRLSSSNGIYENAQAEDQTGGRFVYPSCPTWGSTFRDAGYTCVHWGKKHDAGTLKGFQHREITPLPQPPVDALLPGGVAARTDAPVVADVEAFLQAPPDQPFVAAVDIDNPHDICRWLREHRGPHHDEPLPPHAPELPPLPSNFMMHDLHERAIPVQQYRNEHISAVHTAEWTEENWRHYLWAYDRYVERFDATLGSLLDAFEACPAKANTYLLFWADHGEGMAQHQEITKGTLFYDSTTRVPLVIAGPGLAAGWRDQLVSLIDLFPTCADLAGVEIPHEVQGQSLLETLRHPSMPGRDHVIVEWREHEHNRQTGRMLRDSRWKYIHYLRGGEELYDLQEDSGETRTLAKLPEYQSILMRFRQELRERIAQSGDTYFSLPVERD